ncbi:MAG: hypothetical protein JKY46_10470 [Robiginitomaculum sp.]|nr:hypothetical protein [Robiginitomaculum sp.]
MLNTKLEKQILGFLPEKGSVSGGELFEEFGKQYFVLWRTTTNSEKLANHHYGQYYLRIDAKIEGFARLSPSILRNFLTYSRVSRIEDIEAAVKEGKRHRQIHRDISEKKRKIARKILDETLGSDLLGRVGVLIAGDVCRDMAHEVPRPERYSGEMVKGSDIDLVLIMAAEDAGLREELENRLLEAKSIYLRHPDLREEIDFVVNSVSHYQNAVEFKTPSQMISCKSALEGQMLAGTRGIIEKTTAVLSKADIPLKVLSMTELAFSERLQAVELLRKDPDAIHATKERRLFYFSDEIWEFMFDEVWEFMQDKD